MDQRDQRAAFPLSQAFLGRHAFVVLLFAVLGTASSASAQQAPVPEVSFPILVSTDAGDEAGFTFGYDPNAADSNIEGQFLEVEQPPLPPSTIFDVRLIDDDVPPSGFGAGLLNDIRQGGPNFSGTKQHEVRLQPGEEASSVTFEWYLPPGVTGTLKDVVTDGGQVDVSMEGRGSYTLTNLDITKLFVTLDYDGSQPSINIQSLFVDSDDTYNFKNTGATVDFTGVSASGKATLTKFRNAPDGTDGISESNVSEYRYVIESDEMSFGGDATLRLADSTLAGMNVPTSVQVYRRDSSGAGTFESVATSTSSDQTEIEATASALGEFVLASDDSANPLPVELTQFTVRRDGKTALVQWRTASEANNAGFEVQRRGPGAADYAEVGYVESKAAGGTTIEPTSYRHEVSNLTPGTHQFRLRQVDIDGTAHFSEPVSLTVGMDQPLWLSEPSPHPVRSGTQISFRVRHSGPATVELYNVLGRRIATLYEGTPVPNERQTIRLRPQELAGVASGVYFVRLEASGASRTRRLTVVR